MFVALYHTYMYLDAVYHWLNYYLSSDLIASPEWMVLFFFRITRINKQEYELEAHRGRGWEERLNVSW